MVSDPALLTASEVRDLEALREQLGIEKMKPGCRGDRG